MVSQKTKRVDLFNISDLLKRIPTPFQSKYLRNPDKQIREKRCFDKNTFLRVMFHLVAGANHEGYDHALMNVFDCEREQKAPHRSSFCKIRRQIKWAYFHDIFYQLIRGIDLHRTTFHGLTLYAIDGHQINLPRTRDLLKSGFCGYPLENGEETYLLKGYMCHCYDVLTGVSKAITLHPSLNEHRDRHYLVNQLEENSLCIYDKLYFSEELVNQHGLRQKRYFLARCKDTATKEIEEFFNDPEKMIGSTNRYGKKIFFIKAYHPTTNEISIFATNLPESWHKPKLIQKIYSTRWNVEISFLELAFTTKCEQWHSKTINGILQELFCLLWLINFTKICMLLAGEKSPHPLDDYYEKSNFKLCFNFIVKKLGKYWHNARKIVNHLIGKVKQTCERRKHFSRSYPREIKRPQSRYKRNNVVASAPGPPSGDRIAIVPN